MVLACQPSDVNIVLERLTLDPANRYDLVVATNIFVYYDAFQQTLALENIGAMLKPGGLLLTNDRLPEFPGGSMRLAGLTDVRLVTQGVIQGDTQGAVAHAAIGWYQRRPVSEAPIIVP